MPKTERVQETADLTNVVIGEHVSTLRKRAQLTVKQVGELIGVGESAASYKIKGANPWQAHEVRILADRFDVKVGVLYGDDPMPLPTVPARVTPLDPSRNANRPLSDYSGDVLASVTDLSAWKNAS